MPTDVSKRLGYGGSAGIYASPIPMCQLLIVGGGMDEAVSPSYIEAYDIPPNTSSRSKMLHADGTTAYSGTLNFDVTKAVLDNYITASTLLGRGFSFQMHIHDGTDPWMMQGCLLTSFSITGSAGGLLSASLSYKSITGREAGFGTPNAYVLNYTSTPTQQPLGYWWSGNTDVKEWTLTMNQAVDEMYTNQDTIQPKYLRHGLVDYSLDVTTYQPQIHNMIVIASTSFTLTGVTAAKGYAFNGVTDLGMYSHSFATAAAASAGSAGVIIT